MACLVPSHYLNQCWLIVNWTPGNKFYWYLNRNYVIFIQEMRIWKCRLPKWRPFCPGGDELRTLFSYFSMNNGHFCDSDAPLSINPTHIWVRGKQPYIIISNCWVGKCWSFPHILCQHMQCWNNMCICIRDGSWRCSCFVTWFCYLLIAKSGNNTATPPWPEPLYIRC